MILLSQIDQDFKILYPDVRDLYHTWERMNPSVLTYGNQMCHDWREKLDLPANLDYEKLSAGKQFC